MPKEQKLNVLISHSWMDKLHAEKLSKALDGLCNIWMDYRKLRPGDQLCPRISRHTERFSASDGT